MGRPPQNAQESKPVRTRRKRGGTEKMTLGEASQLLDLLRTKATNLNKSAAVLEAGAASELLQQEADKIEARAQAIEALTVEVPA